MLLDTNIILDYIDASRPMHRDATDLLEALFLSDDKEAVIAASSIKDAYYILCGHYHHNESIIRDRLNDFRHVVKVAELTIDVLDAAFISSEPDLEDAIIRSTAELLSAEAIITRDASAYAKSFVPSMDARSYCMSLT